MFSHFLIGIPGAGKSTFAQILAQTGHYHIISTDAIRQQLYGDEVIQGEWSEIEAEVLLQFEQAIASQVSVIYDATNAVRPWRVDLLNKIKALVKTEIKWLGWYLDLPINLCQEYNQQRSKKVPADIIENMAKNLQEFPPITAEGFDYIYHLTSINDYNIKYINNKLQKLV